MSVEQDINLAWPNGKKIFCQCANPWIPGLGCEDEHAQFCTYQLWAIYTLCRNFVADGGRVIFNSCDQVQMKLTQLELTTSRLATSAECLGKRERERERERGRGGSEWGRERGRERERERETETEGERENSITVNLEIFIVKIFHSRWKFTKITLMKTHMHY